MSLITETSEQLKANVLVRLRKIAGQIRGIENMIENSKDCSEILIQVKAVKSALHSMTKVILKRYIVTCHHDLVEGRAAADVEQLESMIEVLINFVE